MDDFLRCFIANLHTGKTVFDVGAGKGEHAQILANHGYRVTCLDVLEGPHSVSSNMTWIRGDFRDKDAPWLDWINADAIFCRNVLHFYRSEWVRHSFVSLVSRSAPNCTLIAMQAFRDNPSPNFGDCSFSSYWSPSDLASLFPDFKIRFSDEPIELCEDVDGVSRAFLLSRVVVTRDS
jgi:hypothetical protein